MGSVMRGPTTFRTVDSARYSVPFPTSAAESLMPVTHDLHIPAAALALRVACREWQDRVPAELPRGGAGWAATMACLLEAAAAKPGNVHPAAAFPDLTHDDFVAAAITIGPIFQQAVCRPLGAVILEAVRESRRVTRSNANLGMILAIAPLAAVPADTWATVAEGDCLTSVSTATAARLARLDATDAAAVWLAIGDAGPGGLGTAHRHDLAGPPPDDILTAMRLAAGRDAIAALWANGYANGLGRIVDDLSVALATRHDWRQAIVDAFLKQLARAPDSLIRRRHGASVAAAVSAQAAAVLSTNPMDRPAAEAAFDDSLRAPRRINPGTTADLIAAAVYILLRRSVP
jgi:triphosphoribosyl-dephospho-CoA synthase